MLSAVRVQETGMPSASKWESKGMRTIRGVLAIAVVTIAACGKKPEAAQTPATDTAGKMAGMQMAMQGMQMMPVMRTLLDSPLSTQGIA